MHDLRYAIRLFLRRPLVAAVVVMTLSVGLGATVAAFAVVDRFLLREPALLDPDRLVMVSESSRETPDKRHLVSPADFHDFRASGAFASAAAWMSWSFNLTGEGAPERLRGVLASDEFFPTLLGKRLDGDVVISHALWQRAFGGASDIAGRRITLSGERYTVAAVLPRDFAFPDAETDVWIPLVWGTHFQRDDREGRNLRVIARLGKGIGVEEANAIVRTTMSRIAGVSPATHARWSGRATPLHEEQTRELRPTLLLILAGAMVILVIACANAVNLMLMLGASRRRELATRVALGGGRLRLLRQSVAEGVVLGSVAAIGATAFAALSLRVLMPEIALDARAVLTGVAAALLASIASALLPALLIGRWSTIESLRDSHQMTAAGSPLRSALVVAQVALTCALLVSAGVLSKSFIRLTSVDPGFDPRNVLTARVWLPATYETSAEQRLFFESLTERLRGLPGVRAAATIQDLPLRGNAMTFDLALDGGEEASAAYRVVSDGYFDAMRIPILRGRGFTPRDDARGAHVFVINRELALRAFAGADPIGRRVRIGGDGSWGTIVGVAGDVKQMGLDAEEVAAIYEPLAQKSFDWLRWSTVVLRTDSAAPDLAMPIRHAVMEVDPQQPVYEIVSLDDVLAKTVARQRVSAWIVAALGAIAFVIALIGIGGLLAYAVSLRSRELGIRLALGATPASLVRLVLQSGGRLVVPGVLAGLAMAVSVSPLLDRLLFRVAALDVAVYASVALAVLFASALAALVPARRAASIDPAETLRV